MLLLNSIIKNVHFRGYAVNRRTHAIRSYYDVLGLLSDCTTKQIKEAYIKKSKEHHPDRNNKNASHNQFVEVQEAYSTLSKPERRRVYDIQLKQQLLYNNHVWKSTSTPYNMEQSSSYGYDDPSFWMNSKRYDRNRQYDDTPYGISGIKKLSNEMISLICIFFTCIGVTIQILALRYSTTLSRDKMLKESLENEKILAAVRENAIENGNDYQIDALERQFRKNRFYQPFSFKE